MERQLPPSRTGYSLKVDDYGRSVIPADSQIHQACRAGEPVVAIEDAAGTLAIKRYADLVRDVQAHFRHRIPPGVSLVSELLD